MWHLAMLRKHASKAEREFRIHGLVVYCIFSHAEKAENRAVSRGDMGGRRVEKIGTDKKS